MCPLVLCGDCFRILNSRLWWHRRRFELFRPVAKPFWNSMQWSHHLIYSNEKLKRSGPYFACQNGSNHLPIYARDYKKNLTAWHNTNHISLVGFLRHRHRMPNSNPFSISLQSKMLPEVASKSISMKKKSPPSATRLTKQIFHLKPLSEC